MIDHLADLLARHGDDDGLQVRRSKALGILARPEAALALLATAGDQPLPGLEAAGCNSGAEPQDHHADPDHDGRSGDPADEADDGHGRAAVLHFHLAEETVQAGKGVVRMEEAGPITLELLLDLLRQTSCNVTVQPVIDPRDATPVDQYETPRLMREKGHLPKPDRHVPVGIPTQPASRPRPHHPLPVTSPGRSG